MADCGHALCLPFDACRFVVRTQAERHTDGTTWRPAAGVNPDDPELACTAWRYPDPPPIPDHYPPDAVDLPAPRRRWWHRYTRRPR